MPCLAGSELNRGICCGLLDSPYNSARQAMIVDRERQLSEYYRSLCPGCVLHSLPPVLRDLLWMSEI